MVEHAAMLKVNSRMASTATRIIRSTLRSFVNRLPRSLSRAAAQRLSPRVRTALRNYLFSSTVTSSSKDDALRSIVSSELATIRDLDILLGWPTPVDVAALPVIHPVIPLNIDHLLFKLLNTNDNPYRFVVLLNALTHGGADLYAVSIYRALAKIYGRDSVLFMVTDKPVVTARDWLPPDANIVMLDDLQPYLDDDSKGHILRHYLSVVRPTAIFNVNSNVFWKLLLDFGPAISAYTRIFSCLFCYEVRNDGLNGGYAAFYFRDTLHMHDSIFLDNNTFRDQLISDFSLPETAHARLKVLYTPLQSSDSAPVALGKPPQEGRKRVLWAGRFVLQKLPELAMEVARQCPEFDFHFHGEGDSEMTQRMRSMKPPNATLFGRFPSMDALLDGDYDLLLYTSLTDGVPTVLQAAAKRGLPIVASSTGGIAELVTAQTGWPVSPPFEPAPYVVAIKDAFDAPENRRLKVEAMRERVWSHHDPAKFEANLRAVIEAGA